jgi:hypothetical protein
VFRQAEGEPLSIEIDVDLKSKDRVTGIEIIKNGEVVKTLEVGRAGAFQSQTTIKFENSGWFLVRAMTDNPRTFRFASTAPYYVEIGGQQRVSREAVRFFQDWLEERAQRVPRKLSDVDKLQEVMRTFEEADRFWKKRLEEANVE